MRIGGRWGRRNAGPDAKTRQRAPHVKSSQAFGVATIALLVLAGAVGAGAPPSPVIVPPVRAAVTPVAAVSPSLPNLSGPVVVSVERSPTAFHVAEPALSAPPPPMIVNAPGALGIPSIALSAYRNAEQKMAVAAPGCGISWNLLAGIGRIESGHAGGGAVDARGTAVQPIYGPSLDGTLPGNEVIISSSVGNRVTYARAMGPMQFLPGTWARYASDGDGDGIADPQNLFDSTLAAAPLPVQRRAQPARPVGGHGRDPALQQLGVVRAERARLGRRVRHRRRPGRPAPDHRPATPARRRAPRAPGGAGAEPADECQWPADRRPDVAHPADRLQPAPVRRPAADVPLDDAPDPAAIPDAASRLHPDLRGAAERGARPASAGLRAPDPAVGPAGRAAVGSAGNPALGSAGCPAAPAAVRHAAAPDPQAPPPGAPAPDAPPPAPVPQAAGTTPNATPNAAPAPKPAGPAAPKAPAAG